MNIAYESGNHCPHHWRRSCWRWQMSEAVQCLYDVPHCYNCGSTLKLRGAIWYGADAELDKGIIPFTLCCHFCRSFRALGIHGNISTAKNSRCRLLPLNHLYVWFASTLSWLGPCSLVHLYPNCNNIWSVSSLSFSDHSCGQKTGLFLCVFSSSKCLIQCKSCFSACRKVFIAWHLGHAMKSRCGQD